MLPAILLIWEANLGYRLIIIPLSFLRRLDSLKYTSVIALISIGYLIILVVAHFVEGDTMQHKTPLRVIQWESKLAVMSSLPVVVFAYTCHQNVRGQGHSSSSI
jgi:amino acid permease